MSTQPKIFLTPEQYLEIERKADHKSEFFNGETFAMAGAKRVRNQLVAHLIRELGRQLRSKPCDVYPGDMRVYVKSTGLFTYPDVSVACGEQRFLEGPIDTLLNPSVIVEVLSPSTEAYDRGRKFEQYQLIESLSEYLLLASDGVRADLYTRRRDGRWLLNSASRLEDSIALESVGAELLLEYLYERIDLKESVDLTG